MQTPSNWNDLRYFLAVQRSGSLAEAARKLKVDQTTVGRRLSALEASLAARLFDRSADGLVLTGAGERILRLAEELERSMLELEHQVAGDDARIGGTVRLTTSDPFATGFVIRKLTGLRKRHPELQLELQTGS